MADQKQITTNEKIKRGLLLLFLTSVFVALMIIMGKSFELARKPIPETASGGVKKIHKEYLVGVNIVFLVYIYFLIICYVIYHWINEYTIFALLFAISNFALSFTLVIMAGDSLNKIKDDNELPADTKDDYKKLMTFIVTASTISAGVWGLPLLVIIGSLILGMASGSKKTQQNNQK